MSERFWLGTSAAGTETLHDEIQSGSPMIVNSILVCTVCIVTHICMYVYVCMYGHHI